MLAVSRSTGAKRRRGVSPVSGCRRFNHTIKLVAVGFCVAHWLVPCRPLQKPRGFSAEEADVEKPRYKEAFNLSFMDSLSLYEISCLAAGFAGNLFAFALFLSPVPTFKRILKAKSTEQFDGLPYLLSLLNCFICLWYGLPWVSDGRLLLATVNGTGAVFQLAYISLFFIYADSRKTRLRMVGLLALLVCGFALVAHASIAFFDQPTRQQFVGAVSMASLISMFASPLAVMGVVIRTECVEFMPFYLSLSTLLMSASFAIYGVLLRDFFIYLPNGLGVVLGATQLALYAYYSRKRRCKDSSAPLLA